MKAQVRADRSPDLGSSRHYTHVLIGLGIVAAAYEIGGAIRARLAPSWTKLALFLVYPALIWMLVRSLDLASLGPATRIALTFLIVVPIGPMVYRSVFQPLADTSILVLLIAAVATHLVLVGIGLMSFGPEGSRTTPLSDMTVAVGSLVISGQSLLICGMSVGLMGVLAWAFSATLIGKALRATAVNCTGARLVGIRPQLAGQVCFTIAAFIGVLAGVLISPLTTIYYDFGFLIALKGFVAAVIGGLASYPISVAGAVFIGIVEAFASFWASAYRDVIIFSLIIPVLLIRSVFSKHVIEDDV